MFERRNYTIHYNLEISFMNLERSISFVFSTMEYFVQSSCSQMISYLDKKMALLVREKKLAGQLLQTCFT